VIEAVTGKPYEAAARELVLEPLGLKHSFFFPEEVMVHSFAVGHNVVDDVAQVATPWALARTANPAGGLASSAGDQLRYARFHMGDGTAEDGTRVLSPESMALMQTPMASAGVDREVGLSWFLREIEGVRIVEHGGGTNGQVSEFMFAPERNFALTLLTNANRGAGSITCEVGAEAVSGHRGDRACPRAALGPGARCVCRTVHILRDGPGSHRARRSAGGCDVSSRLPRGHTPPVPPPFRMAVCGTDRVVALDGPIKERRRSSCATTTAPLNGYAWEAAFSDASASESRTIHMTEALLDEAGIRG
jgi:CubicO group peptidase (beta-lactamase class C family)